MCSSDLPAELLSQYERSVMLTTIDHHWREHLAALDHLRQGIHLRGYAQKNPKQEYKREAFEMFGAMLDSVKLEVTRHLLTVQIKTREEVEEAERQQAAAGVENLQFRHAEFNEAQAQADGAPVEAGVAPEPKQQPIQRHFGKIGRNDPCPCGSGKKFKHCHGALV